MLLEDGSRSALALEPRAGGEAVATRAPAGAQVTVEVDDAAQTRFEVPLRTGSGWMRPEPTPLAATENLRH